MQRILLFRTDEVRSNFMKLETDLTILDLHTSH